MNPDIRQGSNLRDTRTSPHCLFVAWMTNMGDECLESRWNQLQCELICYPHVQMIGEVIL